MTEASARPGAWEPEWVEQFLRCNGCGSDRLERKPEGAVCPACGHRLDLVGPGLLSALAERPEPESGDDAGDRGFTAVTQRVRRFYEAHPFPNYDGFESTGDLLARASRSVYAAQLDRQIPTGARVLEVGCGTGQLGAFLSLGGRTVVGVDMTRASLELAGAFKARHGLDNCNFLHANLFELPLAPASFDLVVCKGVLVATPDARRGFRALCEMVRPGGYVLVGVYNRIGRIPTTLRRLYFRLFRADPASADYVMREMAKGDEKSRSWFLDQYSHPHETRHSVDEVLGWFAENDLDYVSAVPPIRLGESYDPSDSLFRAREPGGWLEHLLVQISWVFTISREGALFDMIARKRGAGA